jgi:hypothetical protein
MTSRFVLAAPDTSANAPIITIYATAVFGGTTG